jgi:glycosyltransferase involved in cell wall biosynthesis
VRLVEVPGLLPARWRYGYDPLEVWRRLRWVDRRAGQFDVVHAFDSRPAVIYPALRARAGGARLVMDWCDWFGRGGAVEERPNPLARAILRPVETYYEEAFRGRARATTVISRALHDRALGLGIAPESIVRLPNGADPDRLQPLAAAAARQRVGLPLDAPLVGYLGSLFAADAALLAGAFARVRQARPHAQLIVVGNPKHPPPVPEGQVLTGFVSDAEVNAYLAACDVLLLPLADTLANRGRWPSKLMDYFAAGRAVAGCAVGEVGEILRAAEAGLPALPNGAAFAGAILALLADPEACARYGQNARRAAESRYNWAVLAQNAEQLYTRVLAAP